MLADALQRGAICAALLAPIVFGPGPARAETVVLPGAPRAIVRSRSASRDTPALEYAYGPRAQLSLGHDLGIVRTTSDVALHIALGALFALENARSHSPLPEELGRLVLDLPITFSFDAWSRKTLGERGALELGVILGVERPFELRSATTDRHRDVPHEGDIPFGGSGAWLGFDLAIQLALGDAFTLSVRLSERVFVNGWVSLFGQHDAARVVATGLGEGLSQAPSLDATLRWHLHPRVEPTLSLYGELLVPSDELAQLSGFGRALLGAGFPGEHGTMLPFLSLDVGSGKGWLVNRHELRFSAGVRYVLP